MKELTIEETKQYSLDALVYIDEFCRQNNITWWLCGGTLLGAVRHKGFIPWDDDIDIMLPRKEFDRMFKEFPKCGRYRFLTTQNTNCFPFAYGKIVDTTTLKEETIRTGYKRIGIDIDVFPIDNLPSDYWECAKYYKEIAKLGLVLDGLTLNYGKGKSLFSTLIKNVSIFLLRSLEYIGFISYKKTRGKFIELAQKYNAEKCEYWGITSINHYGMKERNLKSDYQRTVMVEFEGHFFPAPIGYKTYLSQLYGNGFMELPPETQRVSTHSFKTYEI